VGKSLITGVKGSVFKTDGEEDFSQTLFVHLAGNGNRILFRAGKAEGGEEVEWYSS